MLFFVVAGIMATFGNDKLLKEGVKDAMVAESWAATEVVQAEGWAVKEAEIAGAFAKKVPNSNPNL